MTSDDRLSLAEQQIVAQLEANAKRIAALSAERETLQKVLLALRGQNQQHEIVRSNSRNRILVERRILEQLRMHGKAMLTHRIFQEARQVHPTLTAGTFRSYLTRMKQKGLLEQPQHGFWAFVEKENKQKGRLKTPGAQ